MDETADDILKQLQELLAEQEVAAAQNKDAPQPPLPPPATAIDCPL
jgi:hypothetical protein